MKIESRTPVRIDLAGGTLDIWPLYLFVRDALTINLGIDLFAQATLEELKPKERAEKGLITLESLDQSTQWSLHWDELASAQAPPSLDLHLRLFRHYSTKAKTGARNKHVKLTTRALSPAGAGLGGSSSLCIAIVGALSRWSGTKKESLIDIVRDIESQVLGVPAGLQDYYGAVYGGLQRIYWRVGSHLQEYYPKPTLLEIERRLLVFYSGRSRNSGINNWNVFKDLIDEGRDAKAAPRKGYKAKFETIAQATQELHLALQSKNWGAVGAAIAREWAARKTLAPGISTPEMEKAFGMGMAEGASAFKVCGAGGGGCFFFYIESGAPDAKARIIQKVTALPGVKHLPIHAVPRGLRVKTSNA